MSSDYSNRKDTSKDSRPKVNRNNSVVNKLKEYIPPDSELRPESLGGPPLPGQPFTYSAKCKVCKLGPELVSLVNRMLISGNSYSDVMNQVNTVVGALDPKYHTSKISLENIRGHYARHIDFESQLIKRILKKRQQRVQQDIEEGVETYLDAAGYAEVLMNKAFQSVAEGKSEVSPALGLQAARTLHEITKDEQGQENATQALYQLQKILGAVRAVVPQDLWPQIVQHMETGELEESKESIEDVDIDDIDEEDYEDVDLSIDVDSRDTLGS